MFSTKAGRKCLVKTTKHNRLAIITMHRGQVYNSFEAVQDELSDIVCNLAPANMTTKKVKLQNSGLYNAVNRSIRINCCRFRFCLWVPM